MNFIYDVVLEKEDICNLEKEQRILKEGITAGKKFLLYGRRNTGKTSLVESIVIPYFEKTFKEHFILNVDLLGVTDCNEISVRFTRAFERGFSKSFPTQSKFKQMIDLIKALRPQVSVDPLGNWNVSVTDASSRNIPDFEKIFEEVRKIEKIGVSVLIVLDEFQDIYFAEKATALMRNSLQHVSKNTGIILLGSKKHLLSNLFTSHASAFFNWGEPIELGPIPYNEYFKYMKERFAAHGIKIREEMSIYIQDLMSRIPEPINILCSSLLGLLEKDDQIDKRVTHKALSHILELRKGKMNEYLSHFARNELEILGAFARIGKIKHPSGKDFLKQVNVSKAGAAKIVSKLLDEAVLYEQDGSYEIADPLLTYFIREYR